MVTVGVNLKEGDKAPEQHLDEGEHIERVIVPLSELYDKLKGKFPTPCGLCKLCQLVQHYRRRRARLWTPGKSIQERRRLVSS